MTGLPVRLTGLSVNLTGLSVNLTELYESLNNLYIHFTTKGSEIINRNKVTECKK